MAELERQSTMPGGVSRWELWFGLFGGLVAWILHLAIGFVIVLDGCAAGLDFLRLLVGGVTLVLALVALAAAYIAYRIWHRAGPTAEMNTPAPLGRIRFMSLTGVWLSGLSFLIILLLSIPVIWLNPCT